MAVLVHRTFVEASRQPRDRPGSLRDSRPVARRVLPQRKNRIHRQPDGRDGRRVRVAGGWAAADVAPRRAERGRHSYDRAGRSRLRASLVRLIHSTPGQAAPRIHGELNGLRLHIVMSTAAGSHTEDRDLAAPPVLALNLARRLADAGLVAGAHYEWTIFDPATLSNTPIALDVGTRELVAAGGPRVPAFRVETALRGHEDHIVDYGYRRSDSREEPAGLRNDSREPGRGTRPWPCLTVSGRIC